MSFGALETVSPKAGVCVTSFSRADDVEGILSRIGLSRFRRNSVVSGVRWLVGALVMVLVFPRMIRVLGSEGFGLWAVLTAPTSMSALVDFGVAGAVVSLVSPAFAAARQDPLSATSSAHLSSVARYALAGLACSIVCAATLIVLGIAGGGALAEVLSHGNGMAHARELLLASLFNLACTVVAGALLAVSDSLGRCDLSHALWGALSVLNGVLLFWATSGPAHSYSRYATVVWIMGGATVLLPLGVWWFLGLKWVFEFSKGWQECVRRVIKVGVTMSAAGIVGSVLDPMVKTTASVTLGAGFVAPYEIGARVSGMVLGAGRSVLAPLLPDIAGRLGNPGNPETPAHAQDVSRVVNSASRQTAVFTWAPLLLVASLSEPLLRLWLGADVPPGSASSLSLLCVLGAISLTAAPHYMALLAMGRGRDVLLAQTGAVGAAAATMGVGIALGTSPWQSALCAAAAGLGVATGAVLAVARLRRVLSSGPQRAVGHPFVAPGLNAVLAATIVWILHMLGADGAPLLAAAALVWLVSFGVSVMLANGMAD